MEPSAKGILIILILGISLLPTFTASALEGPKVEVQTIVFPHPRFSRVGNFDLVSIEGTTFLSGEGQPYLPVKAVKFVLEAGSRVLNLTVRMSYERLPGRFEIPPSPRPKPLDALSGPEFTDPDPEIYSMREPFPAASYTYRTFNGLDPDTLRPVKYVVVYLYPLRYVPATGELYFAPNATVELAYEPADPIPLQNDLDLLIIAPPELYPQAEQLALARNASGIATAIATLDWIYANYAGVDNPEKIRNCIKDYRQNHGIEFVLLFGDADVMPVRLAYIPDGYDDSEDPNYTGDGSFVETDLYYADLDGTWNADGDGYWGEVPDDNIDAVPDVFVGRLPASTVAEAQILVDKVLGYQPDNAWFMTYLMLGTDTFGNREGEYLKDYILSNFVWDSFAVKRLYETWGTLTVANAVEEIDKGYGFINYAGHGAPDGWWFGNAGGFYSGDHAYSQSNGNLSVIFTMACSTSRFYDTDSIGERFLLNPNGGGIAYFGSTRIAWGYPDTGIVAGLAGEIDWRFNEALFYYLEQGTPYLGRIWGRAETEYIINHPLVDQFPNYDWKTVAEYGTPLGDPSLLIKGVGAPPQGQPFSLYGRIYDAISGIGLAGALVSLYTQDGLALITSTYTDAQGNYYLEGQGYDVGLLRVEKEGYYTREEVVPLGANTQVDLPLVPFLDRDVLIVVDDDGAGRVGDGVWPDEIETVLDSLGVSYFTWHESLYGRPPLQALQDAGIGVIWHLGTYFDPAVDPKDAQTLIQFVQAGGNLMLEGEDIAKEHQADDFMLNVAHASFVVDNTGIYTLEVADPGHPITWSLPETFSFELPPPYPDGVSPANGGSEVISYQGSDSAVVAYDGWPAGMGRTVYFAFPLHYLALGERSILIENSIKWMAGVTSPRLEVWPDKGVAVPDVLNVFFLKGYGFSAGKDLWFYLGSWDKAIGRVRLGAPEDTALTAVSTQTGTIPSYAFAALDGSLLHSSFIGVATSQALPALEERGWASIGSVADLSTVPYFTVEGGTVSAGQTIRVIGENFTPDGIVEIYWNGPDALLTSARADSSGRLDVQVVVPESPTGNASLLAYDISKGLLAMNRFDGDRLWLPFIVVSKVELNGTSIRGLAGEGFQLIAHGVSHLNEGNSYIAYLRGEIEANSSTLDGVALMHGAVSADGLAAIDCQLPEDLPTTGFVQATISWRAGAYDDIAYGSIPVSRPELPAAASFDVGGSTHAIGHVGDLFDVYGWNFEWVELVEVQFNGTVIGLVNPDPNGFFHAKLEVPEVPAGDYKVELIQSTEQVALTYTVRPRMWINASGIEVESGGWIRLYAYGLNTSLTYEPFESSFEILPNTDFNLIEGVRVGVNAIKPSQRGTIVLDYRSFYDPSSYWTGDPVRVTLSGLEDSYLAVGSPALEKDTLPLVVVHNVSLTAPRSLTAGRSVWISTEAGLVRLPKRGEPMVYDVDAVLMVEVRGRLWFSTSDSRLGMLNLRDGSIRYWEVPGGIIDLAADRRGNAWFTYPAGYGSVDLRSLELGLFPLNSRPKGITVDRYGNVWVALPEEGSILRRDAGEELAFPLPDAPEWLVSDRMGNVWYTSGRLLCRLNDGGRWDAGAELGKPSIDRMGNVWVVADGRILKFSGGVWRRFDVGGATSLSAGTRDVWFLIDGRLASFSMRRGAVQVYRVPSMSASSIAKSDSSIYVLDLKHDSLVMIPGDMGIRRIPFKAYGMALDHYGNIWLATYGGLIRFDGAEFERVAELPAYAILADRHAKIWFSSRGLLFAYDQRTGELEAYDVGGVRAEMLAPSRGGLWMIEGREVYFLNTRTGEIVARILLQSEARSSASDRRGNLWLILEDKLARISLSDFSVEYVDITGAYTLNHFRNLVYGMKDLTVDERRRDTILYYTPGTVCSLFVGRRGDILAGTMEGSLYLMDFRARM